MRRCMIFKRLLPATAIAFALVIAPSYAQDSGGGAAVVPQAGAAQDETPTTPGGEEQPPEQQPDGEQPPTAEPNPEPSPSPEAGVGGESGGGLPQTGWQAFALASIGLGLLLAGAALQPTSSWPPPRDRLSRSPIRR
jgi:hypothetical protein